MDTTAQAKLLAAKLAVMDKVKRAEKTRRMQGAGNYQYAGAEEIIAELRPALIAERLTIAPCKTELVMQDKLQLTNKQMTHSVIKVTFRLSHQDGGFEEIESIGEAADSMDKSCNKALTAALKYALLQSFLLQGSDDPDDHPSQEQAPPQRQQAKPQNGKPEASSKLKDLLDTFKTSISRKSFIELTETYETWIQGIEEECVSVGLPTSEHERYKQGIIYYWFLRRIDFVKSKLDADIVRKALDGSPLNAAAKGKLSEAINERLKVVQAA